MFYLKMFYLNFFKKKETKKDIPQILPTNGLKDCDRYFLLYEKIFYNILLNTHLFIYIFLGFGNNSMNVKIKMNLTFLLP